jgi:hypothetical protein
MSENRSAFRTLHASRTVPKLSSTICETAESRIGFVREGALVRPASQIARDSRKRGILSSITARAVWSRPPDTPVFTPQCFGGLSVVEVSHSQLFYASS